MKTFSKVPVFLVMVIALVLFAGAANGEEEESEKYNNYNAKLYGTIEKMPEGGSEGTWVINDREILVTKDTKIEEEYGKAEVGAYAEITGNYVGKTFTAYKIEIKMGKKGVFYEKGSCIDICTIIRAYICWLSTEKGSSARAANASCYPKGG